MFFRLFSFLILEGLSFSQRKKHIAVNVLIILGITPGFWNTYISTFDCYSKKKHLKTFDFLKIFLQFAVRLFKTIAKPKYFLYIKIDLCKYIHTVNLIRWHIFELLLNKLIISKKLTYQLFILLFEIFYSMVKFNFLLHFWKKIILKHFPKLVPQPNTFKVCIDSFFECQPIYLRIFI